MSEKKLFKMLHFCILIVCFNLFFLTKVFASHKTIKQYLTEIKRINPNNIDSILSTADGALIHFNKTNNSVNVFEIYAQLSILLSRYSYFSLSEKYSLEAINYAEKLAEKKYKVRALNTYGVLWGRKGDLKNAEVYFLKALLLASKINDREGMASSYLKLGVLRIKTNQPAEALKFYNKIDSINQIGKTKYYFHDYLGNKGILFAMQGKLNTALGIFNLSYQDALQNRNFEQQVSALQNIGLVYKEMGKLDNAESHLNAGISLARKHHLKENELRIAVNVPQVYIAKKKTEQALIYYKDLLKKSQNLGIDDLQFEIRNSIIDIAKQQNDLNEVIAQLEALDKLKNNQYKNEKESAVAEAFVELEFHNLKKAMTYNNDLLFETKKERNAILIISAIILLLLFGIIFSYWNIYNLNKKLKKNKIYLTESNETKNKLFTIIGHDLRSAYISTLGVLGLIKSGELENEEQNKYLDLVIRQSESALLTLNDLLLWGTALIKGNKLNETQLSVQDVVNKNIEFFKDKLQAKGIIVANEIPENCNVLMDINHFSFIVRNLIGNAIKFTPKDGNLKITTSDYSKNQIQINVIDNGIGINLQQVEKIFLPNSKSTEGTNNEKGTGLGLTLCKEFVEANGGIIWAQNNMDKGASICFTCKKA